MSDDRHARDARGGAPEPVGAILRRVVGEVRPAQRRQGGIEGAWTRALALAQRPELARETRPSTLRAGVLTVEVKSSGLLVELQGFRRDELLARLLEAEPSGRITGLRFRLGGF